MENRHSHCELVICHPFEHHQLKCVSYMLQETVHSTLWMSSETNSYSWRLIRQYTIKFLMLCLEWKRNLKATITIFALSSISKQPCTIFAPKKSAKKELVVPTDEGQSFAEILSDFSGKTLGLKQVMHGRVTEKPWSIVNENDKARSTAK